MKLQVSQLPEGDNRFQYQSAKSEDLRALIARVGEAGYRILGALQADIHLTKLEPDYYLKGRMVFSVEQVCARCAETFSLPVDHKFELGMVHVQVGEVERSPELSEESEELDLNFFQGNELDLVPIVEEQFHLSLPYQVLCGPECRGICQQCGKNLNEGPCACALAPGAPEAEPPFAVLKNMKV